MHGILSPEEFVAHARVGSPFFDENSRLSAEMITGEEGSAEGFVNQIAKVSDVDTGESVVVKQTLPFARRLADLAGGLEMPLERGAHEVEAFQMWNAICPGFAPVVYHHDPAANIIVMEDLSNDQNLIRFEFDKLKEYPNFGNQIGMFLARVGFFTSDFALPTHQRLALAKHWNMPDFREIYQRAYFDIPFFNAVPTRGPLQPWAKEFVENPIVRKQLLELRHRYVNTFETMTHSDFHTSNIFVSQQRITVIDGEATCWGPFGYDFGLLIGNMMMSCLSLQIRPEVDWSRKLEYEGYLVSVVTDMFNSYNATFSQLWQTRSRPELRLETALLEDILLRTLRDGCGYAAVISSALAIIGQPFEIRKLGSNLMEEAQRLTILTATEIMKRRDSFTSADQLGDLFKQIKLAYRTAVTKLR